MKLKLKLLLTFLVTLASMGAYAAPLVLKVQDSQGLYWDSGGAAYGQTGLQVYQAFLPNEPTQVFTWTQVGSSSQWSICSGSVCLSDKGTGSLIMGSASDHFLAIPVSGSTLKIQDVTTGRYVSQAASANNGSYIVMNSTPYVWTITPTTGGTTAPTPPPTPPSGSLTVMPLGDSITEGYSSTTTFVEGGYRCALAADFPQYKFVGNGVPPSSTVPNNTNCPNAHWEGHGGYKITDLNQYLSDVGSYKPNLILLMAGTNDVAQGQTNNIQSNLTNFINALFSEDPNAHIFLSTIPPADAAENSLVTWAASIPTANAQIRNVAAKFAGRVTLVDFYSNDPGGSVYVSDGVHPTPAGYAILSKLWQEAIAAYE